MAGNPALLAKTSIRVGRDFDPALQTSFDPTTYTLCHYEEPALGNGHTKLFTCPEPIIGRYVTVHHPPNESSTIILCEVAVYGQGKVYMFLLHYVSSSSYCSFQIL